MALVTATRYNTLRQSITNVLENVQEPDSIDVETEKNPNNLKILK